MKELMIISKIESQMTQNLLICNILNIIFLIYDMKRHIINIINPLLNIEIIIYNKLKLFGSLLNELLI